MSNRTKQRLWSYLFLALLAYAVAFIAGGGLAFVVFVTGGVILELMFWVAVFRRLRSD